MGLNGKYYFYQGDGMAAPKGHLYSSGHGKGRPRILNLDEEAKALEEWAAKEDTLILRSFVALRNYCDQSKMHEYAKANENFRQAFNKARILIGVRREELALKNKVSFQVFNRYAALYDHELRDHEKEIRQQGDSATQIVFVPKAPFKDSSDATS